MKVNKKDGQILLKEEYLSVIFLSVLYNNTNSETADKVKRVCIILHWWRRCTQWYNHLSATFRNGKSPELRGFLTLFMGSV